MRPSKSETYEVFRRAYLQMYPESGPSLVEEEFKRWWKGDVVFPGELRSVPPAA